MMKPPESHFAISRIWPIVKLEVQYRMTGDDTADTWVILTGQNKHFVEGKWDVIKEVMDVSVDYNSVARLKYSYQEKVHAWTKFEKEHARDLAELKRLQAKLGV